MWRRMEAPQRFSNLTSSPPLNKTLKINTCCISFLQNISALLRDCLLTNHIEVCDTDNYPRLYFWGFWGVLVRLRKSCLMQSIIFACYRLIYRGSRLSVICVCHTLER